MNSKDFTFTHDASGYMIQYKGKKIGGAGINGKYSGRKPSQQAKEYAQNARDAINALITGNGQQRFKDVIARIDAELFTARRAKIAELIPEDSEIFQNSFEIPAEPGRYLAVEYSCGDPVWAMNADDLRTIAHDIEASDTSRDDVGVTDLDTGKHLSPEFRVMAFWLDGSRINFDNLKVVAA